MNVFVFDIETVPDVASGRRLYGLEDLDDANVARAMFHRRAAESGGSTMVSWNGSGFDLPVIHYRSLLHGVAASRYWDTGTDDRDFKWNNYLSRYHERHTDLMDVLAGYQPRATARLDEIATMLGFPGKMGMSGAGVWDSYQAGDIEGIRNYCETDVLNTYLVFQRFELVRGHITPALYEQACDQVRTALGQEKKPHLDEFLKSWAE